MPPWWSSCSASTAAQHSPCCWVAQLHPTRWPGMLMPPLWRQNAIPGLGFRSRHGGRPRNQPSTGRGPTGHRPDAQADFHQSHASRCIGSTSMPDARPTGTTATQVGTIVATCAALACLPMVLHAFLALHVSLATQCPCPMPIPALSSHGTTCICGTAVPMAHPHPNLVSLMCRMHVLCYGNHGPSPT